MTTKGKHRPHQANTAAARSTTPSATLQLLRGALRSRDPQRKALALDSRLAARTFAAGFARGADPDRARRRQIKRPNHQHWQRGYDAGRRAAEAAEAEYLHAQLTPPGIVSEVSATTRRATKRGYTQARPTRDAALQLNLF
jgi:hypothetical protein